MRLIKFRAWDTVKKEIRFADICEVDEMSEWITWENPIDSSSNTGVSWEIMQFTGLTDKNGVDIYEKMEIDGLYNVVFKDGSYVLIDISNGDTVLLYNYIYSRNGNVEITKCYTGL